MTCKDCINYYVCSISSANCDRTNHCTMYKNSSKFMAVPSTNLPIKVFLSDDTDKNYILRDYYYKSDDGIFMMTIYCIETQKYCTRKLSDFGKSVFLTKEAAEQALREREQE